MAAKFPTRQLGRDGPWVSKMGFGAMGLSCGFWFFFLFLLFFYFGFGGFFFALLALLCFVLFELFVCSVLVLSLFAAAEERWDEMGSIGLGLSAVWSYLDFLVPFSLFSFSICLWFCVTGRVYLAVLRGVFFLFFLLILSFIRG